MPLKKPIAKGPPKRPTTPQRLTDMEMVLSLIRFAEPATEGTNPQQRPQLYGISIEFAEMLLKKLQNPFAKDLLKNAIEQQKLRSQNVQ